MGNFNAGTIEATLTLDRSRFTSELEAAKAQAKRFEEDSIDIDVDLDTGDASAHIAALNEELNTVDNNVTIDADVDVDTLAAKAKLEAFEQMAEATTEIDVDVDLDKKSLGAAVAGLFAMSQKSTLLQRSFMQARAGGMLLVAAILAILPAIAPVAAGAGALAGGLLSAFSTAGIGIGVVMAGVMGTIMDVQKQLEAAEGDVSKLDSSLQPIANAITDVKQAWQDFQSANYDTILPIITQGAELLATVLRGLKPIMAAFGGVVLEVLKNINGWAQGDGFKSFVDFIVQYGVPAFRSFIQIATNIGRVIGGIVVAFAPFGQEMLDGIIAMTDAWAKWAEGLTASEDFAAFLDYVRISGPDVLDMIGNLWNMLINVLVAAAPVGDMVVRILSAIAGGIAGLDPTILGTILSMVGAAIIAWQAWNAVLLLWTAIANANPISIIIMAIAALVAGIMYLWNTNEGFRNTVIAIWSAIVAFFTTIADWFTNVFWPGLVAVWNGIVAGLQMVGQWFSDVWNGIATVVTTVWDFLVGAFNAYVGVYIFIFQWLMDTVTGAWTAFWEGPIGQTVLNILGMIGDFINLVLTAIQAIFYQVSTAVSSIWNTVWNAIWSTVSSIATNVWNFISSTWNKISSTTSTVWNAIKSVISAVINAVWSAVKPIVDSIGSVIESTWNAAKSVTTTVWNAIEGAITTAINGAMDVVEGIKSKVIGAMKGAGDWLYNAGKAIIQGLLNGINSMIDNVRRGLQWLTDQIKKWKGPESVDKKLLTPSGEWIMESLITGIDNLVPGLRRSLQDVTELIPDSIGLSDNVAFAGSASRTATPVQRVVNQYDVDVTVDVSSLEHIKTLEDFLSMIGVYVVAGTGVNGGEVDA